MFPYLLDLLYSIGLTLGVGASTFALIFYISSLADGVVDASERRFLNIVLAILRIGMLLIAVALIGMTYAFDVITQTLLVSWGLFGIVMVNAIFMEYRIMPMRFGPAIAGGSWYTLFFVSKTMLGEVDIVAFGAGYFAFITFIYFILQLAKNTFTSITSTYGGDVMSDAETLEHYATDASAFKILPQAVYFPKNIRDIQELIKLCRIKRNGGADVSLTLRAGGTCMSGGPLNTGWIIDMTKHMHKVSIDPKRMTATAEMGAFFRDIEDKASKYGLMFPAYPSSHRICGIGGMIGNNASGEKSLRCGATSDNVLELEVVLADGSVRKISPKLVTDKLEPEEEKLLELYKAHSNALTLATGEVKKSASGYRLEKLIVDGTFSTIPLFVGAQGTLGIVTKAVLRLLPIPKHTELLLVSGQSLEDIPAMIETIFRHNPEGVETFDIHTFEKAKEHLKEHAERIIPFLDPNAHLFILVQLSEDTKEATEIQAEACREGLEAQGFFVRHLTNETDKQSAWEIRRNSFLLMRDHNPEGYRAIPCIEDVIVPLSTLGTFIHELRLILEHRGISYGFHGHIGDGSLRVIPVFDMRKATAQNDIRHLMEEVFALVKRLKGNMSADHSDGIIRSPFIKEFYGDELYGVFEEIKKIYDPDNIMNPNKKIGGSIGFLNRCLDC